MGLSLLSYSDSVFPVSNSSKKKESGEAIFLESVRKQKPLNLIRREKEENRLRKRLIGENLAQRGLFLRIIQYIISQKCWQVNRGTAEIFLREFFKERKNGSLISPVMASMICASR